MYYIYQNRHSLGIWKDGYVFSLVIVPESVQKRFNKALNYSIRPNFFLMKNLDFFKFINLNRLDHMSYKKCNH